MMTTMCARETWRSGTIITTLGFTTVTGVMATMTLGLILGLSAGMGHGTILGIMTGMEAGTARGIQVGMVGVGLTATAGTIGAIARGEAIMHTVAARILVDIQERAHGLLAATTATVLATGHGAAVRAEAATTVRLAHVQQAGTAARMILPTEALVIHAHPVGSLEGQQAGSPVVAGSAVVTLLAAVAASVEVIPAEATLAEASGADVEQLLV